MALVAKTSILEVPGSFATAAWGVAGGSGTTTAVVVKEMHIIDAILLTGVSTTEVYVSTEPSSDNTFTATHGNNELFSYLVIGRAKV